MTESEEMAYLQGSNAAWKSMLFQALKNLGTDSPEWTEQRWQLERAELVHSLRSVCAEFGDNSWPDNLSLADVIEKYLRPYLAESKWLYTRKKLVAKAKEIRETEDEGWTAFRNIVALIMAVKE